MPEIDTSLTLEISKKEQPDILLALAREKITLQYGNRVYILTDASRLESGRVGIGCYVHSTVTTPEIEEKARIN